MREPRNANSYTTANRNNNGNKSLLHAINSNKKNIQTDKVKSRISVIAREFKTRICAGTFACIFTIEFLILTVATITVRSNTTTDKIYIRLLTVHHNDKYIGSPISVARRLIQDDILFVHEEDFVGRLHMLYIWYIILICGIYGTIILSLYSNTITEYIKISIVTVFFLLFAISVIETGIDQHFQIQLGKSYIDFSFNLSLALIITQSAYIISTIILLFVK